MYRTTLVLTILCCSFLMNAATAHTKVVVLNGPVLRYSPSLFTDLEIAITDFKHSADEVWSFQKCRRGFYSNAQTFTLTQFQLSADLTIAITRNAREADRTMCIENPRFLPRWFWRKFPDIME